MQRSQGKPSKLSATSPFLVIGWKNHRKAQNSALGSMRMPEGAVVHSVILYTTLERIPEKRYAFRTPSPYCFGPTAEYSFLKCISKHSIKSFGPLMGQRRCQALKGFSLNINCSEHFVSVIFIPLLWDQENTKIESIGDKPLNSYVTVTPKLMLFHRQKKNSPQRKTLNLKSTFLSASPSL
ncbi:hypothetical protein NE237_013128 [Protea cynaroides]|uniref:Uncharacterized protein n=1 Tax=Protea cynaroides TaxID=273540 RepID=A0A9Q0JZI1_9MAGN|nr:hypothetical protein NE237_013128 [Protea cynaroides]